MCGRSACVVYEMLTGRRPFGGEEISDTLASVLRDTPDWQALPAAARPLASVLRRLLEKDPSRRLRDMSDVKLLLTDVEQHAGPVTNVAPRSRWIAGAAAVGVAVGRLRPRSYSRGGGLRPGATCRALRAGVACNTPIYRTTRRTFAISPDGALRLHNRLVPPAFNYRAAARPVIGHGHLGHGPG